jgi:hypothetical protein
MSPLTVFVWSLASLAAVAALGLLWVAVKSRDFDAPTPVDFELEDEDDDADETFLVDEIRLWRRKAEALDELLPAAKECRDACAACFRAAGRIGPNAFSEMSAEAREAGVTDGFGRRLDACIKRCAEIEGGAA